MKLNLGCGFDKQSGFVNADKFKACDPDVLLDIEATPWPFSDDTFDLVLMKHVLEHVGASFDCFQAVMRELYRVTAHGGRIEIHVPHFRHDSYWSDPTHVRHFTPLTFHMMSKTRNDEWIEKKYNYTMIAYVMEVDFEVESLRVIYDEKWLERERAGEFTRDDLRMLAAERWGVARELHVTLKAIKPFNRAPT